MGLPSQTERLINNKIINKAIQDIMSGTDKLFTGEIKQVKGTVRRDTS